jgi:hypothetical protein
MGLNFGRRRYNPKYPAKPIGWQKCVCLNVTFSSELSCRARGCEGIWHDQRCVLRDASLRDAPRDEEESLLHKDRLLMLRRPRSGRLEARTMPIQRFFHTLASGHPGHAAAANRQAGISAYPSVRKGNWQKCVRLNVESFAVCAPARRRTASPTQWGRMGGGLSANSPAGRGMHRSAGHGVHRSV